MVKGGKKGNRRRRKESMEEVTDGKKRFSGPGFTSSDCFEWLIEKITP